MSVAKHQQINSTLIRIPFQESERSEFDQFFAQNKALKKGETVKSWILDTIRHEMDQEVPRG